MGKECTCGDITKGSYREKVQRKRGEEREKKRGGRWKSAVGRTAAGLRGRGGRGNLAELMRWLGPPLFGLTFQLFGFPLGHVPVRNPPEEPRGVVVGDGPSGLPFADGGVAVFNDC